MTQDPQSSLPTIFPYFGYLDAVAALKWLDSAFGFEKTAEILDPDGTVIHAEMRFGNGAIMLGTSTSKQPGQSLRDAPAEHGVYMFVTDVDAHYERAKAAGANIVFPPEDTSWGTRRYRCLDLEGYEWSFGSYRPSTAASNA